MASARIQMQHAIVPSSNAAGATRASCRCKAAAIVAAPVAPLGTDNSRQPSGMQLLASIAERVCSMPPLSGPPAAAYSTTSKALDLDMVYDELEEASVACCTHMQQCTPAAHQCQ